MSEVVDKRIEEAIEYLFNKFGKVFSVAMCGGHLIYSRPTSRREDFAGWFYVDDDEPFDTDNRRTCPTCGLTPERYGPDPCLGWLPDVQFACCGHGFEGFGYVLYLLLW